MRKKYTFGLFLLDLIMMVDTFRLWIFFLVIRYIRTH